MTHYTADVHIHLYNASYLKKHDDGLPYLATEPYPLQQYLDQMIDLDMYPYLVCNVNMDILRNPNHVFDSLAELKRLKKHDSRKYGDVHLLGFTKADPQYATAEILAQDNIKGVRLVLHKTKPEAIDDQYQTEDWQHLYERLLNHDQHFLIYATNPATILKILRYLPKQLKTGIDHLGNCESNVDDPNYTALLNEAKQRDYVYFKGPGYRTSIDPDQVLPYLQKIIDNVGYEKLLLGASDAPHVGPDPHGVPYRSLLPDLNAIINYRNDLLQKISQQTKIDPAYFELINACNTYQIPLKLL